MTYIPPGTGPGVVSSVFSRSGDVTATAGDYDSSEVDNTSTVPGVTVSDALDNLAGGGGSVSSVFGRSGAVIAVTGDYTSTQITNSSSIPGATVSDALNSLSGALATTINLTSLVVASSPTYTTVLTIPTVASTGYTAYAIVSLADDPLTSIRSGRWVFQFAFHRNSAGGAITDGTPSVITTGGFGSMAGRITASGNNVLVEVRFVAGATVNGTVDYSIKAITPG